MSIVIYIHGYMCSNINICELGAFVMVTCWLQSHEITTSREHVIRSQIWFVKIQIYDKNSSD